MEVSQMEMELSTFLGVGCVPKNVQDIYLRGYIRLH